jgi:hypothetical protein
MDLLSPEALGGAGVTVGGIGLVVFTRFVFQLGTIVQKLEKFLENINKTLERQIKHYEHEEKHQAVIEASNKEQVDLLRRVLIPHPRPITGDHTPVPPPSQ